MQRIVRRAFCHLGSRASLATLVVDSEGSTGSLKTCSSRTHLNGEPVPGGRTVEEALAETVLARAIKGDNNCLVQILDRIYGPRGSIETSDGQRVVFEIIPNGRDRAPELESKPTEGARNHRKTGATDKPTVAQSTQPFDVERLAAIGDHLGSA